MDENSTKSIVCLANSRKNNFRCFAGIEYSGGKFGSWIRLVSSPFQRIVSENQQKYIDGTLPKILDLVEIPVNKNIPLRYHTEDWQIKPSKYWNKWKQLNRIDLIEVIQNKRGLWLNNSSSTHGVCDRVHFSDFNNLTNSLRLILVTDLTLRVYNQTNRGIKQKKARAYFTCNNIKYSLAVTDPVYEKKIGSWDTGINYDLGARFLTISLGEEYEGYAYKLVAAII